MCQPTSQAEISPVKHDYNIIKPINATANREPVRDAVKSTHGLHYRVVPPPLRWRGTLGQPKAGGLFFNQSKFWLDNGAAAWYTRGVNQSRRI